MQSATSCDHRGNWRVIDPVKARAERGARPRTWPCVLDGRPAADALRARPCAAPAATILRDLHRLGRRRQIHDRFIQLTEGVIAHEQLGAPRARVDRDGRERSDGEGRLALRLDGGRRATLRWRSTAPTRAGAVADGAPLRLGLAWDPRTAERFAGLGARHAAGVDHGGRDVQLGADRRYTGPDCPPEILAVGGIPQGDYAPVPWLQSSRGLRGLGATRGNGSRFDLGAGARRCPRAPPAGRCGCTCSPTRPRPPGCARYLRRTGMPALLPEWGYGFWKSRDVYEHQDDVLEDVDGCRGTASRWTPSCSTRRGRRNTTPGSPTRTSSRTSGLMARMRGEGVRTVVWVTPWTNIDSRDGQVPPDPRSRQLHAEPASNYAEGARRATSSANADGDSLVARWWMGTGSPVDFSSEAAELWWREQAKPVLALGVEGIKADDGEGYYIPDDVALADGRSGAEAAWALGGLIGARCSARSTRFTPARASCSGARGWTGQQADGMLWGGDQASDFWSLRRSSPRRSPRPSSGFSNWSHDVGGYLGHGVVERCPNELLVRWAQLGCFTPLMQAHGRLEQEPWTYDARDARALSRLRAAARAARPLHPRGGGDGGAQRPADRASAAADRPGDAARAGPSPTRSASARRCGSRRCSTTARASASRLPRGRWIETWSGAQVDGGRQIPSRRRWSGSRCGCAPARSSSPYPAEHVAGGLGDTPEAERPLEATLWGEPPLGRAAARLADGTVVSWRRERGFSCSAPQRPLATRRLPEERLDSSPTRGAVAGRFDQARR